MYVVPTPFYLADGSAGLSTLIVPSSFTPKSGDLVRVGELTRIEVDEIVVSYEFNLETNEMVTHTAPNPNAGEEHHFYAYRSRGPGELKEVTLSIPRRGSGQPA